MMTLSCCLFPLCNTVHFYPLFKIYLQHILEEDGWTRQPPSKLVLHQKAYALCYPLLPGNFLIHICLHGWILYREEERDVQTKGKLLYLLVYLVVYGSLIIYTIIYSGNKHKHVFLFWKKTWALTLVSCSNIIF